MNSATAFCHCCGRETSTVFLALRSGHIGNACAECRALRKGKPYMKRTEVEQAKADAHRGRGLSDESQ